MKATFTIVGFSSALFAELLGAAKAEISRDGGDYWRNDIRVNVTPDGERYISFQTRSSSGWYALGESGEVHYEGSRRSFSSGSGCFSVATPYKSGNRRYATLSLSFFRSNLILRLDSYESSLEGIVDDNPLNWGWWWQLEELNRAERFDHYIELEEQLRAA